MGHGIKAMVWSCLELSGGLHGRRGMRTLIEVKAVD